MDKIQRHQDTNTVVVPADTTINTVITDITTPILAEQNTVLTGLIDNRLEERLVDGTIDAVFNFVTASNFTSTANGTGDNFTIGDDVKIGDVNLSNTLGITGIQDPTQGYVKFGSSGPIVGFASTAALPAAGTAVTGSLLQSGSNLYFYNGTSGTAGGVRGWATVI
jgi:hypothetical protein